MTQDDFEHAYKQLTKMSLAVNYREQYTRQAILFYKARNYTWAMMYQFMFLSWQDEVRSLSDESVGGPGHHLWYQLGGRP